MAFEDLLTNIADEAERTQLAAIVAKYPKVKEYVELGQDVEPAFQKLDTLGVKDKKAELLRTPEWVEWRVKNTDPATGRHLGEAAAIARATTLEADLNELRAKGVDNMTTEELDAYIASKGVVTKADLDSLKGDLVTKNTLSGTLDAQARRFQEVYTKLSPRQQEYRSRYGKEMPIEAVFSHMERQKVWNEKTQTFDMPTIEQAYEAVVAPAEREMEKVLTAKQIEEAEARGIAKGIEQASMSRAGQGMPVGGGGAHRGIGGFMQRIMQKRDAAKGDGQIRLGDGQTAREGFQAHLKATSGAGQV